MIQKYGKTGAMLTVKILGKTSIFHGIRLGAKSIKGEEITQRQLFEINIHGRYPLLFWYIPL